MSLSTNIPAPRVPLIDSKTGLMTREWYMYFFGLFTVTGIGSNQTSLLDILQGPPAANFSAVISAADVAPIANDSALTAQLQAISSTGNYDEYAQLAKQIQSLEVQPPQVETQALAYGAFYDTTTQTHTAINTAKSVTYNSTSLAVGVARDAVNTSRIYVYSPGSYNIQFSFQMTQSAAALHYAYIWFVKNGTDIANSSSRVSFQGANSDLIASWNFIESLAAGDYVEIKWAVDNTGVSIINYAATAFSPAIPSAILTINKVSL